MILSRLEHSRYTVHLDALERRNNLNIENMRIILPNQPRGIPALSEIEEVLLVLCRQVNLNPEYLEVNIIGGQRNNQWSTWGIKVQNFDSNQTKVRILVSCRKGQTVEGFLHYTEDGKPERDGEALYNNILRSLGGKRTLQVNKRMIRRAQRGQGISFPKNQDTTEPAEATEEVTPRTSVPDTVHTSGYSDQAVTMVSDDTTELVRPAKFDSDNHGGRLTNDGATLHLAVTALVTQFSVEAPFGFEDLLNVFINVAQCFHNKQEVKVRVRVFIRYGFMRRLNPGVTPARYTITDRAVAFAQSPEPEKLFKTLHHEYVGKRDKSGDNPEEEEGKPSSGLTPDLVQSLQSLKARAISFQELPEKIKCCQEELQRMRAVDTKDEENKIAGEIQSLEKRLAILRQRRTEIVNIQGAILQKEEELNRLRDQSRDPELIKAHAQYGELKKLLSA